MREADRLSSMAAIFSMGYGGGFNVMGTQTGRIRRNQCVKCQTKIPPGRNGRLCKPCRDQVQQALGRCNRAPGVPSREVMYETLKERSTQLKNGEE